MKYYAVADSPNELMHYGVKGMKWGQHIFGDKQQKSPGYKKAVSKLRASMKDGIKKSQAHWRKSAEQKQQKQAAKQAQFNAKAQARLDEALGNQAIRSARKEQNAIRREMRRDAHAERREQRQMDKYLQKARHGTLKYKKLRDDQIDTIAERLNRENMARRLSGNETPHMLTRIKRAVGEGVVRGVGSAVAVGIEERARAKARYSAEKKYGEKTARIHRQAELNNNRKFAKKEAEAAQDKAYYTMLAESGEKRGRWERYNPHAKINRQKRVAEYNREKKRKEEEHVFNLEQRRLDANSERKLRDAAIQKYLTAGFKNKGENGGEGTKDPKKIIERLGKESWKNEMYRGYKSESDADYSEPNTTRRLTSEERRRRRNLGSRGSTSEQMLERLTTGSEKGSQNIQPYINTYSNPWNYTSAIIKTRSRRKNKTYYDLFD